MSPEIEMYWDRLRVFAGPFPPAAFDFVQSGLRHTCERIHGDDAEGGESRHVTGQELCLGLREHAIAQYGGLAKTVLNTWNVRRTHDFGRIVFAMVEAGLLRKTAEDRVEDFEDVFDFADVFDDALDESSGVC